MLGEIAPRLRSIFSGQPGNMVPTLAGLNVSPNPIAMPTPYAGTVLHTGGMDGVSPRILMEGFGTNPQLNLRSANGTAAIPTATLADNLLGAITFFGYGATGYSQSNRGGMRMCASENFTDSAQGTYLAFYTTANGAVSSIERVRIDANNVGMGTATPASFLTSGVTGLAVGSTAARNGISIFGNQTGSDASFADYGFWNNGVRMALIQGFRSGADNSSAIVFGTANAGSFAERVRIDPAGKVGIGMIPSYALDVTGQARFSSYCGIGVAPSSNIGLYMAGSITASVGQYGIYAAQTYGGATTIIANITSAPSTAAAATTTTSLVHFYVTDAVLGAASAITNQYGLYVNPLTSATNNWAVYTAGTTPSLFGGRVTITNTSTYGILGLDGVATGSPYIDFLQAGTEKAYIQYVDNGASTDYMQLSAPNFNFNLGNVGIHAADPQTALDVRKASQSVSDRTTAAVRISDSNFLKYMALGYDATNGCGFIQSVFSGSSYTNLILNPGGGNLGIGSTSTPTNLVDIRDSIATNGTAGLNVVGTAAGSITKYGIYCGLSGATTASYGVYISVTGSSSPNALYVGAGTSYFATPVGINATPNYPLEVGGTGRFSATVPGDYILYAQNASTTGYGIFIRNGLDTQPALAINNAANSLQNHQLFGNGYAYLCRNAGSLLIGSGIVPSGGGQALVITNSSDPTSIQAGTAGVYAKTPASTCQLWKFDGGGTKSIVSPHADDASIWLYDEEDPLPRVFAEENSYLGFQRWTNESRHAKLTEMVVKAIRTGNADELKALTDDQCRLTEVKTYEPTEEFHAVQRVHALKRLEEIENQQVRRKKYKAELDAWFKTPAYKRGDRPTFSETPLELALPPKLPRILKSIQK